MISEENSETNKTLVINVKTDKKYLSPNISLAGIEVSDKPTTDNLTRQLEEKIVIAEALMSLDTETPSPALQHGYDLARKYVNVLRSNAGLNPIDAKEMNIYLLNNEKFNRYCDEFSSMDSNHTMGFSGAIIQGVAIRHFYKAPEYYLASNAFHELIHKWMELNVRVFDSEEARQSEFKVYTQDNRTGLSVPKLSRDENGTYTRAETGELLNELPNYLLQKAYLSDLMDSPEYTSIFSSEFDDRNKHLENIIKGKEYTQYSVNGSPPVILHKSLVHFDKDGVFLLKSQPAPFLMMQLASDLNLICGQANKRPFWQTLYQAKIDPKLQVELKEAIDAHMGDGFYYKLKGAKMEPKDLIDLLLTVQRKIYTIDRKVE